MKDDKIVQKSVGLPEYLWDIIQQDADEQYVSTSAVIRKIIVPYYEEKESNLKWY